MLQTIDRIDMLQTRRSNIIHNCPQCKGFIVQGEDYYRTKISEWDEKGRRRYYHTFCLERKLEKELRKTAEKDKDLKYRIYEFLESVPAKEYIERRMREDYEFIRQII